MIEANWEEVNRSSTSDSDRAIDLLRLHVAAGLGTASADAVRVFLDRAQRLDPRDDRVWLGKANLAVRQGAFDEAARWLEACLKRRPEDVPVWRARLNWALATNRDREAREAIGHLPAAESPPAEVHRLAAWFAAHRGDATAELQRPRVVGRGRAERWPGPRSAGRTGGPRGPTGSRRRSQKAKVRVRFAQVSIQGSVPARPAGAGRGGTGPPCGATGPMVRGQSVFEPGGDQGTEPR